MAKSTRKQPNGSPATRDRVAIVDGVRTPFVRAFAEFKDLSSTDLAKFAVRELLQRTELDPELLDEIIMGTVLPPTAAPNVAREIVLGLGLPRRIPGFTVTRACASSTQALINAAEGILCGNYEVVIAGGTESMSNVPVTYSKSVVDSLMALSKARTLTGRMKALTGLRLEELVPKAPEIAETATGKSMGQHAEIMARKNGISRQEQDEFALQSHLRAAAAAEDGRTAQELCPVWSPPAFAPVEKDGMVRTDTSLGALGALKPAFDRRYGSLTAGNSSGLTDGASAVLVMSESRARELGYSPLAYVRSWSSTSLDPEDQLLLGPAYAIPSALDKAGLTLAEMDLVEMHEAFAAQVLSVLKALESADFAREKLGRDEPVGTVDRAKLNVNGGSIALGHPFGATGTRIVLNAARELARRDARYACLSLCAAGAMGTAMVLER